MVNILDRLASGIRGLSQANNIDNILTTAGINPESIPPDQKQRVSAQLGVPQQSAFSRKLNNPLSVIGAGLLAQSGQPVNFGQALGNSILQGQQVRQARDEAALRQALIGARIRESLTPQPRSQVNIVNPDTNETRVISEGDPVPEGFVIAGDATLSPRTSAREQQISRLMETGIDRDTAISIADGRRKVSRDPVSGQAQIIDVATGSVVGDAPEGIVDPAPRTDPVPPGIDPLQATGSSGFFGNLLNAIAAPFGQLPAPEVEAASNALRSLQTQTTLALTADIPGRPTNFTRERIEKNLTVSPNEMFRGDAQAVSRLKQAKRFLRGEIERIENDILSDPGKFKPEQVSQSRVNLAQLKTLEAAHDQIIAQAESQGGGNDLPEGARRVGTLPDGTPVFELPDGSRVKVTP